MFEIEAHYHDRKIYLSDDRTYPLGEILLRYFSMNSTALEDLYDVCERAKTDLNISSLFCPADIGRCARDIEFTYDSIMGIAEALPPYEKKHFRRGCICRSQNRSCTDLKPHFAALRTALLPAH